MHHFSLAGQSLSQADDFLRIFPYLQRKGSQRSCSMHRNSRLPWRKPAPAKSRHTKLTVKSKTKAKAKAKRAGRKYPNLVDNMNAAKKQRRTKKRK
jgi:hypothetical protein